MRVRVLRVCQSDLLIPDPLSAVLELRYHLDAPPAIVRVHPEVSEEQANSRLLNPAAREEERHAHQPEIEQAISIAT